MGQLQVKPARLRAVSLLLIFSEGNACLCESCPFRFSAISLGGVRKKGECSYSTNLPKFQTLSKLSFWQWWCFLFLCCNLSRLICIHYSQAVCKRCTFQSHLSPALVFIAIFVIKCIFIYKLALQSCSTGQFMYQFQKNR